MSWRGAQAGDPFSEVVGKAKELGYTEPDPRDDLGGVDVARKALILARTMGMRLGEAICTGTAMSMGMRVRMRMGRTAP